MTKKHFIEIAKILKDYQLSEKMGWGYDIIEAFSTFCSKYNKNFNKSKFLEACNIEE